MRQLFNGAMATTTVEVPDVAAPATLAPVIELPARAGVPLPAEPATLEPFSDGATDPVRRLVQITVSTLALLREARSILEAQPDILEPLLRSDGKAIELMSDAIQLIKIARLTS